MLFVLSNEKFDEKRHKADFIESCQNRNEAGAYSYFEGRVRNSNEGREVEALEYEAYSELAQKEGAEIVREAIAKFKLVSATCIHRTGYLELGEISVWIAAAAPHRSESFAACRYIIDEIKKRVPIWKREHYVDSDPEWVNCANRNHSELSESEYYSRQFVLPSFGILGQNKLKAAKVLVIGAGGLGSPALLYLAGAGCGQVDACDFDSVELSNLHRQIIYTTENLEAPKASVATARIRQQNPFINSKSFSLPSDAENTKVLFKEYDVILDCTDNLDTKLFVSDCAIAAKVALISASVRKFEAQLHIWVPTQENSKAGGQCLRCLWHEKNTLAAQSCVDAGILGAVTGIIGSMQALEAIKYLVGISSPLANHICLIDLLSLQLTQIATTHNEDCPTCNINSQSLAEAIHHEQATR